VIADLLIFFVQGSFAEKANSMIGRVLEDKKKKKKSRVHGNKRLSISFTSILTLTIKKEKKIHMRSYVSLSSRLG
jgi:hypothetical protein